MIHSVFWERNPALLYGITLLIGTSSALFWPFPWNWIWPALWSFYLVLLCRWPTLLFLFGAFVYGLCLFAKVGPEQAGYFSISSLKPHQSPFAKGLIYKGMLTVGSQRVPCTVHAPFSQDHPKANRDYILQGELKERAPYDYLFKAKKWTPVPNTWSLAELRFQAKEKIRTFLESKLKRPRTGSLLGALLTGDVEDRSLRYEFGRLGLQHILAVSGFHFAILMAFCSLFLGLFLPPKGKYIALLCMINVYFIFLGASPAVQRSYLIALLFLVGKLLKRQASGLNLLGAALFIELLLDPFISANLGFQLSFLSCAGILLFRPIFIRFALFLFPKHQIDRLNFSAQNGYLMTTFLRESIAIVLAVNAALLPLILFHFHSFPLLSLFYNLFFPFLISIALFLLLLSLVLYLLFPPLSLFYLTDWFTAQLLELSAYPPLFLDYSIRLPGYDAWIIPIYLFALFSISLLTNTSPLRYDFIHFSDGDRSSVG